jgi:hypothetical protein
VVGELFCCGKIFDLVRGERDALLSLSGETGVLGAIDALGGQLFLLNCEDYFR